MSGDVPQPGSPESPVLRRRAFTVPLPGGRSLELGDRTLVMGIINVTPDSFAERGGFGDPAMAVDVALRLEAEGADIVDIGGESTRPGAEPVDAAEELRRVGPVIRAAARRLRVPLSVDTYKAEVARAAVDLGAVIVNDISGLRYDAGLGPEVARSGAAIVLMHTRGRSREMYKEAVYRALPDEVVRELGECLAAADAAGINRDRVILDPGFGFAKQAEHSYRMLAWLAAVAALGRPLLAGVSRKSFLARPLGEVPPPQRDWATAAAVTAAILAGAHIVRVHAVAEMAQVVRIADEIRRHAAR